MKIALCSYTYAPAIGGIETAGALLADQFSRRGHEVTVITQTDGPPVPGVVRQPNLLDLFLAFRRSDLVFLNNISLRYAFPAMLAFRPMVITTHTYLEHGDPKPIVVTLKRRVLFWVRAHIAVHRVLSRSLPLNTRIIPPPFDASVFSGAFRPDRARDLVFVGRLVADKGCDVLLQALRLLRDEYRLTPNLTVIGGGPEEESLRGLAGELGLVEQVTFTGPLPSERIREELLNHRLMVVPSRWKEPFGIVALEAIASGLFVIGSTGGGLPDAIGPCGWTFPNGDVGALARLLAEKIPVSQTSMLSPDVAAKHLARFTPERIADEYLVLFKRVLRASGRK